MDHRAHSFGRCQKPTLLKARTQSACFFNPGLARALKSPGYTPGRLKHELCVVLGEKARAFGKTSKTKQTRKCGLARAFPGQKRALARAFWSKYDQYYGLWTCPCMCSRLGSRHSVPAKGYKSFQPNLCEQ
jgi:hypothetical protein